MGASKYFGGIQRSRPSTAQTMFAILLLTTSQSYQQVSQQRESTLDRMHFGTVPALIAKLEFISVCGKKRFARNVSW